MSSEYFCRVCKKTYQSFNGENSGSITCPVGHPIQVKNAPPKDRVPQHVATETGDEIPVVASTTNLEAPTVAETMPCPGCKHPVLRVPALAWKSVACPKCGMEFLMPGESLSWLDRQLFQANGCLLALLVFLTPSIALILGIFGLIFCKHPKSREHSLWMTIIGGILFAATIACWFLILPMIANQPR